MSAFGCQQRQPLRGGCKTEPPAWTRPGHSDARGEQIMEDERFTLDEVATAYKIPIATLRYWRARGEGPRSFRLGRRVFYRISRLGGERPRSS